MDRSRLFKNTAHLLFLIFILNFLANKFYWYSSIWYFDIIMHFLGGVFVGLSFLYFFPLKIPYEKSIFSTIVFVFLVGTCWELFELYFINHVGQTPFNLLDTVSDVLMDLSGGAFSVFLFIKKTVLSDLNKVK